MMIRRYKTIGRAAWFFYRMSPLPWFQMRIWPPRAYVKIEYEDKILLVRNCLGSGKWSLPGGGVHLHEASKAGACREVFEEIGLALSPGDLSHLTDGFTKYLFGGKRFVIYKTRLKDKPNINHGPELTGFVWVNGSELKNYELTNAARVALDKNRDDYLL